MLFVQWRILWRSTMSFVQWVVPSRSSNDVCTMKSPFKINKCCLYNEESLQDHQMLFVQWRDWVPSRSTNTVCTMKRLSPFKIIKCCLYNERVPSRSTNAVCTMKSPFKVIKWCLYNEESLQNQQMLSVQWRIPSRSSNAVCTMKNPLKINNELCTMSSLFKVIKCCLYNEESLQGHHMLFVKWQVHWRSTMSFVQ
jgi:hypothetical protein